ncbi:MAG: aspartate 1-decarboxylase, partial [Methyloceanibacter sp.]
SDRGGDAVPDRRADRPGDWRGRGSREIAVNGAAARLVQTGDKVIIVAYCSLPAEEARNYRPSVVVLGDGNEIERAA